MTAPRWQVLNEADRIIRDALAGKTDDAALRELARMFHVKQAREELVRRSREAYERVKLSPLFKLWVFYVGLLFFSACLGVWQKKLERRLRA